MVRRVGRSSQLHDRLEASGSGHSLCGWHYSCGAVEAPPTDTNVVLFKEIEVSLRSTSHQELTVSLYWTACDTMVSEPTSSGLISFASIKTLNRTASANLPLSRGFSRSHLS